MPIIDVMNWNIEQFSWSKSVIPGTPAGLARVIVSQQIDIVVILELKTVHTDDILINLMTELNALAGGNDYTTAFKSPVTGLDCYGFIIRDPAVTEPVFPNYSADPLKNMTGVPFFTRAAFQAAGAANMAVGTAAAPVVLAAPSPLLDLYASQPPTGRHQMAFPGQPLAKGVGYALGAGYRLPCLGLFRIPTAGNPVLLPIIPCHYAANRSADTINPAAQAQIKMMKYLHAPQIYLTVNGSHIRLDNVPTRLENLIITGDFNVDFARNTNAAAAPHPAVREIYSTLTDRLGAGGTRAPAAAATPPRGVAAVAAVASLPPLRQDQIDGNANYPVVLNTGVTNVGTILHTFDATAAAPANLAALRGPIFDNFFFGGTNLDPQAVALPPPAHMPAVANADYARVVDVPSLIMRTGAGVANGIDIGLTAAFHAAAPPTKNAQHAPTLSTAHAAALPALTMNDRLIGARMLSDHLPVVMRFNLP